MTEKSLGLLVGGNVSTYLNQIAKKHAPGNEAYRWITSAPWYFTPLVMVLFGLLIVGYHWVLDDLYWVEAMFYAMVTILALAGVLWVALWMCAKAPGEWREVSPMVLHTYIDPSKLDGLRAKIAQIRQSEPEAEFVVALLMREGSPPVEGFALIQTMRDLKKPCRLLLLTVTFFAPVQGRLARASA